MVTVCMKTKTSDITDDLHTGFVLLIYAEIFMIMFQNKQKKNQMHLLNNSC